MNKGVFGIVFLLVIAGFASFFVLNNDKKDEAVFRYFHEVIPANIGTEIIEISEPQKNIDDLLNSSLIWQDLKPNLQDFERFWNQTDSQFVVLKNEASSFFYLINKEEAFYIFQMPIPMEMNHANNSHESMVIKNFIVFSDKNLASFTKKYEEEMPLGETKGFRKFVSNKKNKGIHFYQKKETYWDRHELNFLPEQIFSSANIVNIHSQTSSLGDIDMLLLEYLPAQFGSIEIERIVDLMKRDSEKVELAELSQKCGCDAAYSLYDWNGDLQVTITPEEDGSPIWMVKIKNFSGFTNGMNDLFGDSVTSQFENYSLTHLGSGINRVNQKEAFTYLLRMDDFAYFSDSKTQLERLKFEIFSKINVSSNTEVATFISHNVSKGAFLIEVSKGLSLGSFQSEKGITLYQEKRLSDTVNYASFVYSNDIDMGKGRVNPKWEKEFGAALKNTLYKVKNHRTTDHNYLVQDENNEVYFISPNGKTNWKLKLSDPIVGNIKNIDLYGNNKFQLVFNTHNQLYVVDVLGRNVSPFPVPIKDSATANVSIVDYDKNQDFRFLVPTTAGIKNIDAKGDIVKGWEQPNSTSVIRSTISHLLIGNLDYLIVKDVTHKVYLYNRKGEERHRVTGQFGEPFHLSEGSSITKTRALFLDEEENTISRKFFDETPVSVLLSPSGKIKEFFFVDFDADNEKEYCLLFDSEIWVYGKDLIIKEKITLPASHSGLRMWKEGYGYINALNDLVIYHKGKSHIVEKAEAYEIDFVRNGLRVIVKNKNTLKLLYLQ